jgi:hypothetical protein
LPDYYSVVFTIGSRVRNRFFPPPVFDQADLVVRQGCAESGKYAVFLTLRIRLHGSQSYCFTMRMEERKRFLLSERSSAKKRRKPSFPADHKRRRLQGERLSEKQYFPHPSLFSAAALAIFPVPKSGDPVSRFM